MPLLDAVALLAHSDPFGAGIGVGMACGFGAGFGGGMGAGSGGGKKKLKRQLSQAIDDGAVTVLGKSGDELTADALLELLSQDYKKA